MAPRTLDEEEKANSKPSSLNAHPGDPVSLISLHLMF